MSEYEILKAAELYFETIGIRENSTGKTGIANTSGEGVAVFYGADDGSEDKTVTPEEFSRDFTITDMAERKNRAVS